MIAYEELDRALARWKARSQNGVGAVIEADTSSSAVVVGAAVDEGAVVEAGAIVEASIAEDGADVLTPLPIRSEELGSIPNLASPATERTGELQADELESYDDDDA